MDGHSTTYPYGGGIYNQESLTVESCTLRNNWAVEGGGIRNDGTLTVTNSNIRNNSADWWRQHLQQWHTGSHEQHARQ